MKEKNKEIKNKRLFITGVARSGTTLLQSMLGSHSLIYTMPEMHLWDHILYKQPYLQVFQTIGSENITKTIEKLQKSAPNIKIDHPGQFYSKRKYTSWVLRSIDKIAQAQGKNIWLEKTPLNLYYTKLISSVDPDAVFIHMLRDPLPNIASLFEAGRKHPEYFSQSTIKECISRYVKEIRMSLSQLHRKNHTFIRYESLISNPVESLTRLCNRLNLPFENSLLDFSDTARKIIETEESWKSKNIESISYSQKYKKILKEDEIKLILDKTKSIVLPE